MTGVRGRLNVGDNVVSAVGSFEFQQVMYWWRAERHDQTESGKFDFV